MNINNQQTLPKLKRNKNATISRYSSYEGLQVIKGNGPLIPEYLDKIKQTFDLALAENMNITLVRVDLHFPSNMSQPEIDSLGTDVISRFWASLKSQMGHYVQRINDQYDDNCVWSTLRYVWCMEEGAADYDRVHYHIAFLVNWEVFKSLGNYGSNEGCLAGMVNNAWARTLRKPFVDVSGSVSFPRIPIHYIKTDENGLVHGYERAFHRLSYFTKSASKHFNSHRRHFGCRVIRTSNTKYAENISNTKD